MVDAKRTGPQNDDDLKRGVLEQLDALGAEDKRKVLDFSRELARRERAREPGGALLAFAGSIPNSDLVEMRRTIEDSCERVDEERW